MAGLGGARHGMAWGLTERMAMAPFEPSREDGRSDRQIVLDLVRGAEPGTIFLYADMQTALEEGTDREINRRVIGAAARAASNSLLSDERRALAVVPGRGYRVIRAEEHLPVAMDKKARASGYISRGMRLLKQCRWEELPAQVRTAQEGQLMIFAGLSAAIDDHQQRLDRHEEVIAAILKRVSVPELTA